MIARPGRSRRRRRRDRQRRGRVCRPARHDRRTARPATPRPGQQGEPHRGRPRGAAAPAPCPAPRSCPSTASTARCTSACARSVAAGREVARVVLTASGGPFRGRSAESLADVTVADALRSPDVVDGPEDHDRLVDADEQGPRGDRGPRAVRHRRSTTSTSSCTRRAIVHSMVEFTDGCTMAQLSLPDMRLPIGYALGTSASHRHPVRTDRLVRARSPRLRRSRSSDLPMPRSRLRRRETRRHGSGLARARRTKSRSTRSSPVGCAGRRSANATTRHSNGTRAGLLRPSTTSWRPIGGLVKSLPRSLPQRDRTERSSGTGRRTT